MHIVPREVLLNATLHDACAEKGSGAKQRNRNRIIMNRNHNIPESRDIYGFVLGWQAGLGWRLGVGLLFGWSASAPASVSSMLHSIIDDDRRSTSKREKA